MSDDPPTFEDAAAEARHYRLQSKDLQDELSDMKLALDDFQASSKELEEEMERDLLATEKRENELRAEVERLRSEVDGWKTRHQTSLRDHSATMAHMQKELESLRSTEKSLRGKLRDMELDNDDLEKSERAITLHLAHYALCPLVSDILRQSMSGDGTASLPFVTELREGVTGRCKLFLVLATSTLGDVENRYNKAVERTALLEQELVDKARLEEELQRMKDELRDAIEEMSILRSHRDEAIAAAASSAASHLEGFPAEASTRNSLHLPVTPSRSSVTNGSEAVPSPDIDSADENSQHAGYPPNTHRIVQDVKSPSRPTLRPSSSSSDRQAMIRASPSKLPISLSSANLSPFDESPVPFALRSVNGANGTSPTPSQQAASNNISRSSNIRNLSSVASRKSLTPKNVRDKRTESIVGEMQDMTSRMQKLRAHLNTRRESMMAGSAIPRLPPSTSSFAVSARVTPGAVPRNGSSSSITRSGSIKRLPAAKGMQASPSTQIRSNSHASDVDADEFKQPTLPVGQTGHPRSSSRMGTASRVLSSRPPSRLSVDTSRASTPAGGRSPTPSSQYGGIGLGQHGGPSARVPSRRVSVGPGIRSSVTPAHPPSVGSQGRAGSVSSALTKSTLAKSPAPQQTAWR